MTNHTRRTFLREASLGLAATTGGALLLRADAFPTRSTAEEVIAPPGVSPTALAAPLPAASPLVLTRPVVAGPFYRPGAPYRAKSTPPFETGTVLLLAGHVWGFDTKRPVAGFHPSLSVPAQKRTANGQSLETATFDIVLERA